MLYKQPPALSIQVPVDHFSPDNKNTYSNRYYVQSTYYKSGGPVFLMDVGESPADDDFVQGYLMETRAPSSVMQLAKKYNGLAVLWEHRFYGESLPFPVDNQTGLAPLGYNAYKYLNTEQALEDVVYFANHFQPPDLKSSWDKLQPSQTPWIVMGGSYPGNRAAWLRIRNPDVFYAAWSSSAPVEAKVDMSSYNEQVYRDMTANCSADFKAAAEYVDSAFRNNNQSATQLIQGLSYLVNTTESIRDIAAMTTTELDVALRESAKVSRWDVANVLSSLITSRFQSYGFDLTLRPYCDIIETFDPRTLDRDTFKDLVYSIFTDQPNRSPSSRGIAATYGAEAAFYALTYAIGRAALVESYADVNNTEGVQDNSKSWDWQTCSEYGFNQVANTSSTYNLLSSAINVTSWREYQCASNFKFSELPQTPNIDASNKYGGWKMTPSNVMFTNGDKDPWFTLSVQSNTTDNGAPNRKTVQAVPACNQAPPGSDVFGLLYAGEYHASDLIGDTTTSTRKMSTSSQSKGLALFSQALDKWLPCFKQHSISPANSTTGGTSSSTNGTSASSTTSRPSSTSPSSSSGPTGAAGRVGGSQEALFGPIVALLVAFFLF